MLADLDNEVNNNFKYMKSTKDKLDANLEHFKGVAEKEADTLITKKTALKKLTEFINGLDISPGEKKELLQVVNNTLDDKSRDIKRAEDNRKEREKQSGVKH